jgi:hypothetical protein
MTQAQLEYLSKMATAIKDVVTTVAVIVGGWWAYKRFVRQRDAHPRCSFTLDVRFIGIQDGRLILEVVATLQNQGLVRHRCSDFTFNIRYLLPDDKIESGDKKINHQTRFPHSTKDDEKLEHKKLVPFRPFIDPGVVQNFTYVSSVPASATFILVYSEFDYVGTDSATHSAQKVFRVPASFETSTSSGK